MAIADDFSVAINGDIRYTGSGSNYTVLELHRFLQDLADDAEASGDDLVDITSDTPSDRSTDNIITLNSPYNIDDTAARHLYDGSITQADGDTVYSGLRVLAGPFTGTELMIVQDDQVLPSYWGTGINAVGGDYMRLMIKSRDGGADIDGQRIIVKARELNDRFAEFGVTLGQGNSVASVPTADDLNNDKSRATLEGYTTVAITEGLRLLDIDNDTVNEEYYCEFGIGSQTKNDTYEVSKWWQARSLVTDSGTDTGNDFIVDNGTIVGQGQEFTARGQAEKLTEMRFRLKVGSGTPTGPLTAELRLSDDVGAGLAEPTGGVLATSDEVLASVVTDRASPTTYVEVIFRFSDNVTLTASEKYFAIIRHPNGDASNYFQVEGSTSGADDGNRAEENPAATWTATAADDLWFTVKSTPVLFGRPGEMHRGVTHQVPYTGQTGTFTQSEVVFWGAEITYDGLTNGPFTVGNYVQFQPQGGGTVKNGGKILKDTGTVLTIALEDLAPTVALADNDIITEVEDGTATTAAINVTITNDDKGGGEGIILADGDDGATGDIYIQLISGVAPVNTLGLEGRTSGATATASAPTSRTVNPEFIGQSTGTNIIGAYGVGFDTNDIGSSDLFFDLTDTSRQPPNNVTFTVTGLVSGEDRVLVGPRTGSALEKAQFTTDTALTTNQETTVSISTVQIPTDTPGNGEFPNNSRLRVQLDNGVFRRQPYVSYDAATPGDFTLPTPANAAVQIDVATPGGGIATWTRASGSWFTDGFDIGATFEGANFANGGNNSPNEYTVTAITTTVLTTAVGSAVAETGSGDEVLTVQGWDYNTNQAASGNDLFIGYIDVLADGDESFTAVYNADRNLFVRVRDGGGTPIKTFEVNAVFGDSNSSVAAIRTSDA